MPKKTVAIAGSHVKTRDFTPFDRKYVDIWVFNEAASIGWPKRCDAVFQMHQTPIWKNPLNRNDPNFPKWMALDHPYPIYMLYDEREEVPACEPYPLDDVCKITDPYLRLGRRDSKPIRFITSSPAYAIALAIHQGYERIEIYGIEMESDTEYKDQRDGVFYWLGVAVGRGIEVIIHPQSNLFDAPLYGYEGDVGLKRRDFLERKRMLMPLYEQAQSNLETANRQQMEALEGAMENPGDEDNDYTGKYFASIKMQAQAMMDLGSLAAALEENDRYLEKADAMDEAAGEHIFARQEFELTAARAKEIETQRQAQMGVVGAEAQGAWKAIQEAQSKGHSEKTVLRLSDKYAQSHEEYLKVVYEYGRAMGVFNENFTFIQMVDKLVQAAGGRKAEEALLKAKINHKEMEIVNV